MNGTVIEQSQILTTGNLAVLVDSLGLRDRVAGLAPNWRARSLPGSCAACGSVRLTGQAQLQAVKDAAYAWRQAIYFLGLCEAPAQTQAVARLRDQIQAVGEEFQSRFGPAVDGLAHVVAGGRFDASGIAAEPGGGRRFLGWSVGPHWILAAAAPSQATDASPAGKQP